MTDPLNPVERIDYYGRNSYAPLPVGAMTYFRNMNIWQEYKQRHQQAQKEREKREQEEERGQQDKDRDREEPENPLSKLGAPVGQSPQRAKLDILEISAEDAKAEKDKYFSDKGAVMLNRARLHFFEQEFTEAEQQYTQYIRYHDTFGVGFEETLLEYYPAMFEYTLLLCIQERSDEAHYFINLELAQFLTQNLPSYIEDDGLNKSVTEQVKSLQAEEKLPGLKNYNQRFSSKHTVELALSMEKQGLNNVAEILLGFVKIRQLLKVFKTDLLIGNLPQSEPVKGGFYTTDLPLFYDFLGLQNL